MNQIQDLRGILFDQLIRLKSTTGDLNQEIERSAAMVPIANAIIETGRLENDFLRILNNSAGINNGFITPRNSLNANNESPEDA